MRRIGRFEIEAELGRGSMGVVHLAHDPQLKRKVAVKTNHPPVGMTRADQERFRERFMREAEAAARLDHPAIVTIYDIGDDPDNRLPYIAMEYVEGGSLRDLIGKGPVTEDQLLTIGSALATALQAAHAEGIVHRDIKPANILVRAKDGALKITDFGIARTATSELTQAGHSLGSPSYMSPEQIKGEPVDGRSDLFSLAVVLYEAVCGVKPFRGEDLASLAYGVVHETPVPASRRRPDLSRAIDSFFDKALSKDPERRFPDGEAFAEALRKAVREGTAVNPDATRMNDAGPARGAQVASSPIRGAVAILRDLLHRPGAFRKAAITTLIVMMAGGWLFWRASREATLLLEGRNRFEDATLMLLVDGEQVYSRPLAVSRRSAQVFGKKLFEYGMEKYEARIDVSPGMREIEAQVVPEDGSTYRDKAIVELEPGETRRVKLISGRSSKDMLSLEIKQGGSDGQ